MQTLQRIVDSYVKLNRRAELEDMMTHRRTLLTDLRTKAGGAFDLTQQIRELQEDIDTIAAGLAKLEDERPADEA